jgi:uncharacterized protein YfiM (DUF2279 family)
MSFKTSYIIIILISITSRCLGQNEVFYSKKIELCQFNNSNYKILNPKFKITFSDSWFGRDKVHHFLTSAFLSGTGYYFLRDEQNYSNKLSQQGGFCFSISLGLVKEIRDGFKPQNAFSVKDLVADILGTLVGIAIVSDL